MRPGPYMARCVCGAARVTRGPGEGQAGCTQQLDQPAGAHANIPYHVSALGIGHSRHRIAASCRCEAFAWCSGLAGGASFRVIHATKTCCNTDGVGRLKQLSTTTDQWTGCSHFCSIAAGSMHWCYPADLDKAHCVRHCKDSRLGATLHGFSTRPSGPGSHSSSQASCS